VRSNCVLWAFALARRRRRKGFEPYLTWRWSRWGPFPHVLYSERRPKTGTWRVVSYKPRAPAHKPVPPLVFSGRPRWGDFPDTEPFQGA
jgi:hypothetical protein